MPEHFDDPARRKGQNDKSVDGLGTSHRSDKGAIWNGGQHNLRPCRARANGHIWSDRSDLSCCHSPLFTMTPDKEGPPTLRNFRSFVRAFLLIHNAPGPPDEANDFVKRAEDLYARLTDEALERNEKRQADSDRYREALEKLLRLANTEYHPHSYTVNGSDVKKIASDALTPTPGGK